MCVFLQARFVTKLIVSKNKYYTSLKDYFTDPVNWWVDLVLFVTLIEVLLVFFASQNPFLSNLRIIFGLALIGFLPGYSTLRLLFPKNNLKILEQILLSIFLSVSISIGLGVALGVSYSFGSGSAVGLIAGYTVVTSLGASYRRHGYLRSLIRI